VLFDRNVSVRKLPESHREARMSEHGYRRFLPGDKVSLELEIHSPHMHLHEAGVSFRHEERYQSELSARGPVGDPDPRRRGASNFKVAALSFSVPGGAAPGLYRVNELWVETYGGRVYRYEGEEVAELGSRFDFEVLEEPDEKPELARLAWAGPGRARGSDRGARIAAAGPGRDRVLDRGRAP
jgi:hypothetical protein